MQTDGQLYDINTPPSPPPEKHHNEQMISIKPEEILILGIIYLIGSEKKSADLPLILALVYILLL